MKPQQIVLLIIAIVILNNLALLSYLGHFSAQPQDVYDIKTAIEEELLTKPSLRVSTNPAQSFEPAKTPVTEIDVIDNAGLTQAIEDYVDSDKFSVMFEDWQRKTRQRNTEIANRLSAAEADELHTVALEAESRSERMTALHLLLQGSKFKQLSNQQLKELYTEPETEGWSKAQLLNGLLENDDPEALGWAKDSIRNGTVSRGADSQLYAAVYEKDPNFMIQYINENEFDPSSSQHALISFIQQEPDLASTFYARNFDKILSSNNDDVFMYGIGSATIELNQQQQSRVAELFSSNNRHKRNFAISLAASISDPQILRQAYTELNRSQEQLVFIASLLGPNASAEASSLGRELASSSEHPHIQRLAAGNY
ncbi:MAG: hypothetical protein ACJAQ6_000685 [Arenicella sp.]|jgi:hypothetical protein